MNRHPLLILPLALSLTAASLLAVDMPKRPADATFVRVSPRDSRYFELSDGRPFIPIGLNMIAPPSSEEEQGLKQMEDWMHMLHDNGGNFFRIWLSNRFLT